MKRLVALLLFGLLLAPAFARTQTPPQPPLIQQVHPGVTYEDCVERCKKCGTGKNPDCVKNFCTGYPHRKRGAAPLPVVCPSYD